MYMFTSTERAAQQAHEAGIKKLRIKTDSKFLVNSATEWIPRWKANYWKTYENKPLRNLSEFEKMKTALVPLDVIREAIKESQEAKWPIS